MNNNQYKTLEETYLSIYENINDLAKQDPREAFPHRDDMREFENEKEEDLYKDEKEEGCSCDEEEEGCSCDGGESKE
jgi:hypothetical protein